MPDHEGGKPAGPVELYRPPQAAEILGVSVGYLAKMRVTGRGPKFLRLGGGRSIRYTAHSLREWALAHQYRSTSEASAGPRCSSPT